MTASIPSFWKWFFTGLNDKPGILKYFDRWLLIHLIIGFACSYFVKKPINEVANVFLLPLASILIGLCFAWAGNAQSLLQTKEIESFSNHHPEGIINYVYTFQAAILIILITLVLWGFCAIDVFYPIQKYPCLKLFMNAVLYSLGSLTLRECWHIVLGSQMLLLIRARIVGKIPN